MFRVVLEYWDKEDAIMASMAEKMLIAGGVRKERIITVRKRDDKA